MRSSHSGDPSRQANNNASRSHSRESGFERQSQAMIINAKYNTPNSSRRRFVRHRPGQQQATETPSRKNFGSAVPTCPRTPTRVAIRCLPTPATHFLSTPPYAVRTMTQMTGRHRPAHQHSPFLARTRTHTHSRSRRCRNAFLFRRMLRPFGVLPLLS